MYHCLQSEEGGGWGQIDAPAAKVLFKLSRFLKDAHYELILDMKLPELHGYTPVSSA